MRRSVILFAMAGLSALIMATTSTAAPPPTSPDVTPSLTKIDFGKLADASPRVSITFTNNTTRTWQGCGLCNSVYSTKPASAPFGIGIAGGTCVNPIGPQASCTMTFTIQSVSKGHVSLTWAVQWIDVADNNVHTNSYVTFTWVGTT